MSPTSFNIPGFEIKVKLNSKKVLRPEKLEQFERVINHLISELGHDQFRSAAHITGNNTFSISISGIPDKEQKSYRINVDVGLFRMLYDGLYIILSNNNIFAGCGKAFGHFNIPTLEVPDYNCLDLAMANNEHDVLFDADRTVLHEFLYQLCLSFIIRHEIRHIANGHIDYLAHKLQPLFYENSKNGLEPLDSQTLEMDVDSCVFAGVLAGFLDQPIQSSHMPEVLRNNLGIFMASLFCIQFLFYCMPSKKVSQLSEVQNGSHPNAYLRYFFCFTAGLAFLQEKHPELVEQFGNVHRNNFWGFFDNLSGLINIDQIKNDYDWSMSKEGLEYVDKIWNNWDKWLPKLAPFAYLDLAPSDGK